MAKDRIQDYDFGSVFQISRLRCAFINPHLILCYSQLGKLCAIVNLNPIDQMWTAYDEHGNMFTSKEDCMDLLEEIQWCAI